MVYWISYKTVLTFRPFSSCVCVCRRLCRGVVGGGRQVICTANPWKHFYHCQKPDYSDIAHLMKLLSMLINQKAGEGWMEWILRQRTRTSCNLGKVEQKPSLGRKGLRRVQAAQTEMPLCMAALNLLISFLPVDDVTSPMFRCLQTLRSPAPARALSPHIKYYSQE